MARMHEVDYKIIGEDLQFVEIELDPSEAAVAEAGGADDDFRGEADGSPYASLGLGVRVRLTWFVDIEIEAGFAVPLRDGDGVRFFAGAN